MGSDVIPDAELDCIGLYCPMPIAMTKEEIEKIGVGEVLKVVTDDPGAEEDIKRWQNISESSEERWFYYVPPDEPWTWPTPVSGDDDDDDHGPGWRP